MTEVCDRNLGVVTLKSEPCDGSDEEAAEGGTRLDTKIKNVYKILGNIDEKIF